jgi:PAS domain S-box-containing protein
MSRLEPEASADSIFRAVVEASPNAMLMVDRAQKITLVNRRAEELFGYAREELLEQPVDMLLPPRLRSRHSAHVEAFFDEPVARAMGAGRELFGLGRDGREIPIEIGLAPLQTPRGLQTLASIIDITARRREQERFRLVVEASPSAMLMVDRGGRIILINRRTEELFGYQGDELLGEPIERLVPARARALHPSHIRAFFADARARAMGSGRDLHAVRKDGTEVPVEIGLNPIETAEGPCTLASIIDITGRKEAEMRLRRSHAEVDRLRAQYEDLYENAPDMYASVDARTGTVESCNRTFEEKTGWSRSAVLGRSVFELYAPECRAAATSAFEGWVREGRLESERLTLIRPDGSRIPVVINVSAIRDDDGIVVASRTAWTDISELVRAESALDAKAAEVARANAELERSNRELDGFAYAASHDLRSPLRDVQNLAEWIAEDAADLLPEASLRHLRTLQGRVGRMEALLEGLLAYSRVGRVQDRSEEVDVHALLEDAVELLGRPAAFPVDFPPVLPKVRTPRAPLLQVLQNLIGNAIKHHDRDAGRVVVDVLEEKDHLVFLVRDDGPGIPAQHHDLVFRMFQALRPFDEVEGTGMGLALVKRIVETHGGVIDLQSAEGEGSTFRFTWPRRWPPPTA